MLLKVNSVIIGNKDGAAAATVTISWYNGSIDFYIASTVNVPANSTLVVVVKTLPSILKRGNRLEVEQVLTET